MKSRDYKEALDGLPRSVVALLWALSSLRLTKRNGATYRALGVMLGTEHRTAIVRTSQEAVELKLATKRTAPDGACVVALSPKGWGMMKKAMGA